jgi:hypothetical protein
MNQTVTLSDSGFIRANCPVRSGFNNTGRNTSFRLLIVLKAVVQFLQLLSGTDTSIDIICYQFDM